MSDAAIDLDCNVTVKVIDRRGHIIQEVDKHNKATVSLIDGILRFLQGDFSTTEYNKDKGGVTPEEASPYIPVRAGFGNVGVKLKGEFYPDGLTPSTSRMFDHIDKSDIILPTFTTSQLQDPVEPHEVLTFSRIRQTSFTDPNNSECLKFTIYISPGTMVGYTDTDEEKGVSKFTPYEWAYYNPESKEYEAMLTEVGLLSDSNVLLARVVFDGEVERVEVTDSEGNSLGYKPAFVETNSPSNPIIQSESSTIVLEWRVGITSVGDNDVLITTNDMTREQFADKLAEYFVAHKEDMVFDQRSLRQTVLEVVTETLAGSNLSDLSSESTRQ